MPKITLWVSFLVERARYNVDLVPGGEQLGSGSLGPRPGTRGWYAPIGESILA
jgi:hypothetical protein